MFSIEFLHVIRRHELAFVKRYLPARGRILEIGGGTGFQARLLAEHGFEMVSIDVPQSNYAEERVFPVVEYDGVMVPFADASFDIVFSSNVLEHVRQPAELHNEIRRILKPRGLCLHAMPSGSWSFWTIVTHYLSAVQRLRASVTSGSHAPPSSGETRNRRVIDWIRGVKRAVVGVLARVRAVPPAARSAIASWRPPRHGEVGNAFTEIATFSRFWWRRHFRAHGYRVLMVKPMGLFYTGYMLWGAKCPIRSRERVAPWLGSACVLYKVEPGDRPVLGPDMSDNKAKTNRLAGS